MRRSAIYCGSLLALGLLTAAMPAGAQVPYSPSGSFHVQCPGTTLLHPTAIANTGGSVLRDATSEPDYTGPQALAANGNGVPLTYDYNGGTVKCQEISGGDGYMTEADGNQTFMFSFGPLSGLGLIQNGQPGTLFATDFNHPYAVPTMLNGQPNPYCTASTLNPSGQPCTAAPTSTTDPGANGALTDPAAIMDTGVMNGNIPAPLIAVDEDDEFFLNLTNVGMIMRPDLFEQHTVHWHGYPNASSFYDGVPDASLAINIGGTFTYYYLAPDAGTYFWHCHITPPEHLQMGMVGQLFVRPRQNRVPVGSSLYQSAAGCKAVPGIQGGACPAGDTVGSAYMGQQSDLRTACNPSADILCSVPLPQAPSGGVGMVQGAYATADPLGRYQAGDRFKYVYNDGDGSTRYDIDVPIQIHGFDPNFHFVGMTFNAEPFSDMKDKYFLLNGRSYPDTIGVAGYAGLAANTQTNANCDPGSTAAQCAANDGVPQSQATTQNPNPTTNAISTEDSDGYSRPSQPMPTLIKLYNGTTTTIGTPATCGPLGTSRCGQRASLRIADLDVSEYQTLASLGLPMQLIGFNAKLLRDQAGNNLYQTSNSITLGGGESLDVIIDSTGVPAGTYFLYTPNLDHLSNDAENFGGLMAEVVVLN